MANYPPVDWSGPGRPTILDEALLNEVQGFHFPDWAPPSGSVRPEMHPGQHVLVDVTWTSADAHPSLETGVIERIDTEHPYPIVVRLDKAPAGTVHRLQREVWTLPASKSLEDLEAWLEN